MVEKSLEHQYGTFQVEHVLNSFLGSRKSKSGPVRVEQSVEVDMTHHSVILGKTRDGMQAFAEHVNQAKGKSKGNVSGLLAGLIRRI